MWMSAHNDGEIEVIKRSARQLMDEATPSRSDAPDGIVFPTEYADLQEVFRKAPRPEKLDVDLGDCCEETRLSLGLCDVMGTVNLKFSILTNAIT